MGRIIIHNLSTLSDAAACVRVGCFLGWGKQKKQTVNGITVKETTTTRNGSWTRIFYVTGDLEEEGGTRDV